MVDTPNVPTPGTQSVTQASPATALEAEKLALEISLLRTQARWEAKKNLVSFLGILVPLATIVAVLLGGIRYFNDEAQKEKLHREEIFTLGMRDLASSDEFVRAGAATVLAAYAGQDRTYARRVIRLLSRRAIVETPTVKEFISETLAESRRQFEMSPQFRTIFPEFRDEVNRELNHVNAELDSGNGADKNLLTREKQTLEQIVQLLHKVGVQ